MCVIIAFLQLGQPKAQEGSQLLLCDSQDIRHPFSLYLPSFDGTTDCWHRCTVADIVSSDAQEWMLTVIAGVEQQLEASIRILWCASNTLLLGLLSHNIALLHLYLGFVAVWLRGSERLRYRPCIPPDSCRNCAGPLKKSR
jgi:hypothetical protein